MTFITTANMRIVLPSNASAKYFPNNTLSEFQVKLPQAIDLSKGRWEVGLEEIMFFKSWYNVANAGLSYYENRRLVKRLKIPDGFYETPTALLTKLNEQVNKEIPGQIVFIYDEFTQKCTIGVERTIAKKVYIKLSASLKEIIGNLPPPSTPSIVIAGKEYLTCFVKTPIKLHTIFNVMVYSDICNENIVGDTESPLLRSVAITKKHWQMQTSNFTRVQYIPVSKKRVETISIYIYTDYGTKVPFVDGRVICTLDLRRVDTYSYQ